MLLSFFAFGERGTGLSKETLRVWERRHGFVQSGRNAISVRACAFGKESESACGSFAAKRQYGSAWVHLHSGSSENKNQMGLQRLMALR